MLTLFETLRLHLRTLLTDIRHGAGYKIAALTSRAIFLFMVADSLPEGTLSSYVFLSTVAAFSARLLCMGLEEQLPISIAGGINGAALYSPLLILLFTTELIIGTATFVLQNELLVTILLTLCYTTTSLMAGALRTVLIVSAERLRDLHWVAFVGITVLPVEWQALQLMGALSLSLILVQLVELSQMRIAGIWSAGTVRDAIVGALGLVKLSWRKLFATAFTILIARSIILWPKSIASPELLDQLAFALLLAEAFSQTAMILVFRKYAAYCSSPLSQKEIFADGLRSVIAICLYGGIVYGAAKTLENMGMQIGTFDSWGIAALLVLFFAILTSYILLRYIVWVFRDFSWLLAICELIFFFFQGLIIWYTPERYWALSFVIIGGLALLATIVGIRKSIKPRQNHLPT